MTTIYSLFKGQRSIWITLILSLLLCAAIYLMNGVQEEIIRLNIRITARISFFLFSLAFIASSLLTIKKSDFTKFLMQNRRYIGLSFGVSHLIHLINILILLFFVYDGDMNGLGGWQKLSPAIIVYIYIFVMMSTSNNFSVALLGTKLWTWLHRLGMYSIAAALGLGFYKVVYKDSVLYLVLLLILAVEIGIRVYIFILSKNKRPEYS